MNTMAIHTTPASPVQATLGPAMIAAARLESAKQGRPILTLLEEACGLEPHLFLSQLADLLDYAPISMKEIHAHTPDFELISFSQSQQKGCLALRAQGQLQLVFADPFDENLPIWVESQIDESVTWRLAHRLDIAAYLAQHEESMRAMDAVSTDALAGNQTSDEEILHLSIKSINEDTHPIVKLVNSTLYDALKAGASDIHLESVVNGLMIKYRIDGVIAQVGNSAGAESAEQAISRIKVMSQLDIAERRIPQDGRFKVLVQGREVDFRVSIMPSVFGEDAVLRILDRKSLTEESQALSLKTLGFNEAIIRDFRRMANEPYGMLLVTGPTGSGKTTSLYAAICEVNTGHDKIITIEDPVEYQLPGVLQIPVNEKKGLTFARGLRSVLRHDPDKIMVGEIRDGETAQIAVQAALTGHLVFTTVHANNVLDVIARFMHMGVDPYNFVSAVNGILAQRLVRELCPHCAEPYQPDAQLLEESGVTADMAKKAQFKHAQGCGHCRGTGYKGRRAVAELLILNDELREMIIAREPIRKLKEAAHRNGMRTIREAALDFAFSGQTTLQEINRVTFVA